MCRPSSLNQEGPTIIARRFLFVGGPFGPFYRQLGHALRRQGHSADKVILQGGDRLDWGFANSTAYRGNLQNWPVWIEHTLRDQGITDLITYGDCQVYNKAAIEAARSLGCRYWIFEHGYFRPNWITIEKQGVNANSEMSRDPEYYFNQATDPNLELEPYHEVGPTIVDHVLHTMAHTAAYYLAIPFYRSYTYPYSPPPLRQGLGYLRRGPRLLIKKRQAQATEREILSRSGQYFICYLQKEGDSQIISHSSFQNNAEFYNHVLRSFAEHAPPNVTLVFKNHPLDPGHVDHRAAIQKTADHLNISSRALFIDGGNNSLLTKNSMGAVTINSTAGLSAIYWGVPTIALGDALFNISGLVNHSDLSAFWKNPQAPDTKLANIFRIIVTRQVLKNGSYYSRKGRQLALKGAIDRLNLIDTSNI